MFKENYEIFIFLFDHWFLLWQLWKITYKCGNTESHINNSHVGPVHSRVSIVPSEVMLCFPKFLGNYFPEYSILTNPTASNLRVVLTHLIKNKYSIHEHALCFLCLRWGTPSAVCPPWQFQAHRRCSHPSLWAISRLLRLYFKAVLSHWQKK